MNRTSSTSLTVGPCYPRFTAMTTAIVATLMSAALQAALPRPLVDLPFVEGSGVTTENPGSLGGTASFVEADGYPGFTNNVPSGPFAPTNNKWSLDFGSIAADQGGRALDLASGGDGTLGALNGFTVCGWLNARDLTEGWGGNRIAFALESPNGAGFDLVHLASGALRIGINQWPDGSNGGGPSSSAGLIKAEPGTGNNNWVFFAVTYDPALESGNLKYFIGSGPTLASLDTAHDYRGGIDNGGMIEYSGPLTVGNFGSVVAARTELGPNGGSRVFRGLIDELKIYDRALDAAEVQQAQLNGALPPVPATINRQPASTVVFEGQPATFRVQVNGSAPFTYQWQRDNANIEGATNANYTLPAASMADNGAVFRVKVSNPVTANVTSDPATLSVLAEDGRKVIASFSEATGLTTTNVGNLAGSGLFAVENDFPVFTTKVPKGAFSPTENQSSVDFGTIDEGQGGRAIDFTNGFGNQLGPMTAFTVTGWLNCRDLREGWGGNRIAFALASPGGPGFDLVQTVDGGLRLGVNQWPDAGDGGPRSTAGLIPEDPETGDANWMFFAVTYDSTSSSGQVTYYFGKGDQAAQADVTADYERGPIVTPGALSIGNFGPVASARNETGPNGGSRVFRGLMDEIKVFSKALSLGEIQAEQKAAAYKPATVDRIQIQSQPKSKTVFAGQSAQFEVVFSGSPPFTIQWQRDGQDIAGETTSRLRLTQVSLADHEARFRAILSNARGPVASDEAVLKVLPEDGVKIVASFSEGQGTTTANAGNLGGSGAFTVRDGFPVFAAQVPAGAFAPTGNAYAVDFGAIAENQGGRAIDFTNAFDNTLGPMSAFTVTGWLNCRDAQEGWGGNRIAFALASPGGPGFDLVQTGDGSLRLGVNQWPDAGDGGPRSSAGMIAVDPDTGTANWVFFAATYDSALPAGQVTYYFGNGAQAAQADVTADYARGAIETSGAFSVGNFGPVASARNETGPAGGSRVFRGLIDEINVFSKALTMAEIQAVQKAAARATAQPPTLAAQRQAQEIVITWESTATFQLQYRAEAGQGTWIDETTPPVVDGNRKTVRLPIAGLARFYRLVSR